MRASNLGDIPDPRPPVDPQPPGDADDVDADELITQFLDDLKAGICPICHQPMTRVQIGADVYAHPCRHRLYRGRVLPKRH